MSTRRRRTYRKYTDAEKAAYYKKLALRGRGGYRMSKARAAYGRPMRGRGGYYNGPSGKKSPFSAGAGAALGAAIGAAGGPPGIAIGSALGALGGSIVGDFMGWGDYKIRRNSIYQKISEGNSPARMHTSKSELTIAHREYICDIVSSPTGNTFSLQSFNINPGLVGTLPWGSSIAAQFEQYEILGMIFEFKTLSADAIANTTNTALGYVVMATDYNAINPLFTNKQSMENAEYTTSCKPSISMYHPIECDPALNPLNKLYVRTGAAPSGSDLRMYDLGIFQIATSCPGSSVVLGELWCSYEIRLKKPISTAAVGQDVLTDHYQSSGCTAANPLGNAPSLKTFSSIGGTINGTGTIYTFPAAITEGTFLCNLVISGTNAALTAPGITVTNGNLLTVWRADANNNASDTAGTSTNFIMCFIVNITNGPCSLTFGTGGAYPGQPNFLDLWVTQTDAGIIT
jgi:hypothetical protein